MGRHEDRACAAQRMAFVQIVVEDLGVRFAAEVISHLYEDAGAPDATNHVPLDHKVDVSPDRDPEVLGEGRGGVGAGGGPRIAGDAAIQEAVAHDEPCPKA